MTISQNDYELDQLFTKWFEDQNLDKPLPLKTWIAQYPQYTQEFISWAANAPLLARPENGTTDPDLEAQVIEIGTKTLMQALERTHLAADAMHNLLDQGKKIGLQPQELAVKIGVGRMLLARLNQCLIQAETIPVSIISKLAETLEVQFETVQVYLSGPARLSTAVNYKADQVPRAGEKRSFQAAVEASTDLTHEEKMRLLQE